ncbi:MAG: DUF1588 domain-containing protein [Akkermansiaceae bacterium]
MRRFVSLIILSTVLMRPGYSEPASGAAGFKKVVLPFFEDYCLGCHDEASQKGKFSLEKIDPDLLKGDDLESWRLIRDQLFFEEMPPKEKDQPTAEERRAVLDWIRGELLETQRPDLDADPNLQLPQFGNYVDHEYLFTKRLPFTYPAPPRIWRLRPEIYNNTLPRLGERVSGLANGLSKADGPVLKDYASIYFIDEASTAPLLGNAKKIANSMTGKYAKDKSLKRLLSDEGAPDREEVLSAVQAGFIRILGRKATKEEEKRFTDFHAKSTAIGGYQAAGKALVTAILMQPEVLYRQELGDGTVDKHGRTRLSQTEIAYALSYALENRPLDEFLKAAPEGKLADAEQIRALVTERLKDDTKMYTKNPRVLQFFREYFDYPYANEVFKDQPEGGQHESGRLVDDLEMTIIDILQADKNVLAELLTTRKYYVNTKYGSKKNADKLERRHQKRGKYHTAFNLPPDWKWSAEQQPLTFASDERAGVLTHPAWLAAWSGNFENHPVQRGKWIRTHLLGGSVPDVPIGVDARVPEAEHVTFRNRLKEATKAPECWRCHKSMDPLGLAFERYDHYGRYQRLDAGQPVDASAEVSRTIVPELHRSFSGPTEMMEFLAKSEYVEQVFVRYVFRYFMGRNETLGDANTLQDAHKAYRDSGGSFNALIVSLLSSDSFLLRQVKP